MFEKSSIEHILFYILIYIYYIFTYLFTHIFRHPTTIQLRFGSGVHFQQSGNPLWKGQQLFAHFCRSMDVLSRLDGISDCIFTIEIQTRLGLPSIFTFTSVAVLSPKFVFCGVFAFLVIQQCQRLLFRRTRV